MNEHLYSRYLQGFGSDGRKRCSCGQVHTLRTREILLGEGVSAVVPERVRAEHGKGTRVWVLSDERTEAAAGAALKDRLRGLPVAEVVLPGAPKPVCTLELAERLAERVREASAGLIISVGGGTMSDLGKAVSAIVGVPNWGVMTAPSMDAHASGTSNFKTPTGAITRPVSASIRVFCDVEVLEAAPRELFWSGLGDQLAKLLGYLDWRLGAWVHGEEICEEAAEASLESAREMLRALREPNSPPGRVRRRLADALLTSSLVMQSVGHSRSAASAEHTAAHFWEVTHLARNERLNTHGLLVGAATAMVCRAYGEFYARLPRLGLDIPARVRALREDPPWQQRLDAEILPYRGILERESEGRAPVGETCPQSLRRFGEHREKVQELADTIVAEASEGVRLLQAQDYPFAPEDYGMSPAEARLPFRFIRYLRNRTSGFDLMHLLGVEEEIYSAALAGAQGD